MIAKDDQCQRMIAREGRYTRYANKGYRTCRNKYRKDLNSCKPCFEERVRMTITETAWGRTAIAYAFAQGWLAETPQTLDDLLIEDTK